MASRHDIESSGLPLEIRAAAARGWRLFPIRAGQKQPPLLKNWPEKATHDLNQLEAWSTQSPDCNWGLATGPRSGVFVLDIDGEPGQAALHAFHRQGKEIPNTLTVKTARGRHLYFRWPKEQSIRNSIGALAEGLDIRSDRAYVLFPPSLHPNGGQYAFINPSEQIVDAPVWLVAIAGQVGPRTPRALEVKIGILCEGERNDGLTRLAGALRRRGASLEELETELVLANAQRCRPPLPDTEVLRIATSVASYPAGGPDPLERAWAASAEEPHRIRYKKFLALARHLQLARPGLSIALPLKRIGKLMGCDWTQARRWRRRAEREGRLRLVERYVPHRKADLFIFIECPTRTEETVPLGQNVPLINPTNGLVGRLRNFPSGTSVEHTEKGYLEGWL